MFAKNKKDAEITKDAVKETRAEHDSHVREMAAKRGREDTLVSAKPMPQEMPEILEDGESYVFTSTFDFQTSIKVDGKKFPMFFFDNSCFVTQSHLLQAGITVAMFFKALVAKREYPRDFILSSGPGYSPSPEVVETTKKNRKVARGRHIIVSQGPRSTDREKK